MAIRKWNVCTKESYQSGGQEKSFWPKVGELVLFPPNGTNKGGFQLKLYMFGTVKFYVFEDKKKEDQPAPVEPTIAPGGEVDAESIPF